MDRYQQQSCSVSTSEARPSASKSTLASPAICASSVIGPPNVGTQLTLLHLTGNVICTKLLNLSTEVPNLGVMICTTQALLTYAPLARLACPHPVQQHSLCLGLSRLQVQLNHLQGGSYEQAL